jgi:riboflavin synthase
MFTGIIERLGTIRSVEPSGLSTRLQVETGWTDLSLGESVAIDGVCLTVVETDSTGTAFFFVSAETISRTRFGALKPKDQVNLERALLLSTRLSGHLVQGHVDGLGTLRSTRAVGESRELEFSIPESLLRYCVEKGSIAINGVSLTLNEVRKTTSGEGLVKVMIIPHTWTHTDLSLLQPGDPVHLETDILAKYALKNWELLCPTSAMSSPTHSNA